MSMEPSPSPDDDPSQAFDDYAESYDDDLHRGLSASGERKEYFAEGRLRHLSERLMALGHVPDAVLDYGCGDGTTAPLFLSVLGTTSVVGVDTSEKALARATAAFGSDQIRFSTPSAMKPTPQFDLAFCNGVFHHIPPDARSDAMRYVHASLKPGGIFAFWENNPWNPGTRWVMHRIPFDRDAITISAPTGRRLFGQNGFQILSTDFLFVFPRVLSWFRPLEPHLVSTPLGAQYLILGRKS